MKPIKVAHVTTLDSFLRIYLLNQLRSIQNEGYAVFGISAPGSDVAALEAAGVRHLPVEMTRKHTPFADLLSLWRLYRVMRKDASPLSTRTTPNRGCLDSSPPASQACPS